MNIPYPLHVTDFDTLLGDKKKEAETAEEDIICATF